MNLDGGTYMKYIQFTKKENEIMDILWKHDIAMSANDIKLASKNLSINTIQQTLQKLLEINISRLQESDRTRRQSQDYIDQLYPKQNM